MRWHGQVMHVLRKDLHLARWVLLAYLGTVAAATVGAAGWAGEGVGSAWLTSLLVLLTGLVAGATLVLADPPARSSAYWTTLPLSGSAVFAAKLVGAVLCLLVVGLVGQGLALTSFGLAPGELARVLVVSALVYTAWLALGAAIASLSPDFRSYALALVLTLFGWMLFMGAIVAAKSRWRPGPAEAGATPGGSVLAAAVVLGALAVLYHQYRTRRTRRGFALAAGVGLLVSLLVALREHPPARPLEVGLPPEGISTGTLRLRELAFRAGGAADLQLWLEGASPTHSYRLRGPAAWLEWPDGRRESVAIEHERTLRLQQAEPLAGEELRWLTPRSEPRPRMLAVLPLRFTPAQHVALQGRAAGLVLEVDLEVERERIAAELPLVRGAEVRFEGNRVRVLSIEGEWGAPVLALQSSSVYLPGRREPLSWRNRPPGEVAYAVVNRSRGEALDLRLTAMDGTGVGVVLPGAGYRTDRVQLTALPGDPNEPLPAGWLDGARLVLLAREPIGSARVRMRMPAAERPVAAPSARPSP